MLLSDMAAMKAVHYRTDGLKTIAKRVALAKLGTALPNRETSSDTVTFYVTTLSSADLVKALNAKQIIFDEMHYTEDVHTIIADLKETGEKGTADKLPETHARAKFYLQQHIFNFTHSVTEMMRYMTHKDLSLTTSMISLGSCTKKIEFRGVPHNVQLAGGGEHSSPRSHTQHHRLQGEDVELPG